MSEHSAEKGLEPIVPFLPAIRDFMPVGGLAPESTDVCASCGDVECSGACPAALYVVRQVLEAFDHEDERDWWRDYFADEGRVIPSANDQGGTS